MGAAFIIFLHGRHLWHQFRCSSASFFGCGLRQIHQKLDSMLKPTEKNIARTAATKYCTPTSSRRFAADHQMAKPSAVAMWYCHSLLKVGLSRPNTQLSTARNRKMVHISPEAKVASAYGHARMPASSLINTMPVPPDRKSTRSEEH